MAACITLNLVLLLAGRWKSALVAVKVIDHRIKGNGNAVDIQRETILSTSVVHPNVVSICYHFTTVHIFCCSLQMYVSHTMLYMGLLVCVTRGFAAAAKPPFLTASTSTPCVGPSVSLALLLPY